MSNLSFEHFQGAAQSAWGENYCEDLTAFDNQASSIRFTGAPDGYKYDTINFFQYQFYMGAEHYYYGDSTQVNYDNFGRYVQLQIIYILTYFFIKLDLNV